jgi:integrase
LPAGHAGAKHPTASIKALLYCRQKKHNDDCQLAREGDFSMSAVIQLRPPIAEKPTVARGRDKNEAYRVREYLAEAEVEKLLTAAGKSRNPNRDRLLVLLTYRHALRVSELVDLRVDHCICNWVPYWN